MNRIFNSRPLRAAKLLFLAGACMMILNLPLTLPQELIFTQAMAQAEAGVDGSGTGATTGPEMSDYLAVAFVLVAGGMVFHMRRRAFALAQI